MAIGLLAGPLCYAAVNMKSKIGYDDTLDVLGIHGAGGLWGALATGLFAAKALNPAGSDGLFFGNFSLLKAQAVASFATIAYSALATLLILKAVDFLVGLRVHEEHEAIGLDISQHGENGYDIH